MPLPLNQERSASQADSEGPDTTRRDDLGAAPTPPGRIAFVGATSWSPVNPSRAGDQEVAPTGFRTPDLGRATSGRLKMMP